MLNQYIDFSNHVLRGGHGETAKMWMLYLNFAWKLLRVQRATKKSNFSLHVVSLEVMCILFIGYNHPNYAHYTVVYILTILNLNKTHSGAEELLNGKGVLTNPMLQLYSLLQKCS